MKKNYLWAKKSEIGGKYTWLSLHQHLIDSRDVSGLLWEHWLSSGQRAFILDSIQRKTEDDGKNMVQFLASVHDIGKATPAFQLQKGFHNSYDLDQLLIERLEGSGFQQLGSKVLSDRKETPHALAGQFILTKYGLNDDIASIIGGHHGKPINDENFFANQQGYLTNYYQEEADSIGVGARWEEVQRELFVWALNINNYETLEDLPSISQPGQIFLSGLVIMADWIASNENYFPLEDLDVCLVPNQMSRLVNGWGSWFKTNPIQADRHSDIKQHYENRFGFSPINIQEIFSRLVEQTESPGIFILEAPMGSGKTEAALIGAEQLAHKTGKSGIFFGLPTQATSDGMYTRVNSWLNKIALEKGETISIQLVHGKSSLNEEHASLAKNINVDEENQGTLITNQWFAGRKTSILDDFVIGTVDHVLLAALKQKHLALRHLGLSKKVVIIDEVHAYDAYMSQYLEKVIEWLGAYEVPVILLSATLPAQHREKLTRAYLKGKGLKNREMLLHEQGLKTTSYPLVTYTDGNEILQETDFEVVDNKPVRIYKLNKNCLYEKLEDLLQSSGIIGVMVNTVKSAQEIAVKCSEKYGEELVCLLHSNFIATERVSKEKTLLSMIGKGAERPNKKIIIGTQVIEQSLDIDFDVLISDLAPMDLLIQRIGRLHRHNIGRPPAFESPSFYVMGTSDELDFDSGSKYIYGGYLLTRTQHYLPNIINIPEDISPLVQQVYGDDQLILDSELETKYIKFKNDFHLNKEKKEDRAKTYLLSSPVYEARRGKNISLIKWLDNSHPNQSEEYGYAQVRDLHETIEVVALKKLDGGYGFIDSQINISEELNKPVIAKRIASSTIRLPLQLSMYGNADKTIKELEKYNLEHLADWQDQVWLKGSLGILFDENNNFEIGGKTLHYDRKYGLSIWKGQEQ